MTIYEAAKLIKQRKISSFELTGEILAEIKKKDGKIGAYITVCEDEALKMAQKADKEQSRSILSGIPVAVKDNICTRGILTTAGSRMLESFVPPYDATVVKKLKEANAVIVGKTNMDEFGMGSTTANSAFKATLNPINCDYVPGGSSGGSAAAVKGNMALGALGSDTGGSVRQPAAFCGLYGLRPTYSLVSRYGLIAFASSLDAIGPICQSVEDTAIMLGTISGYDEYDATSSTKGIEDYLSYLNGDIKGLRIGVVKELYESASEEVKKAIDNVCRSYTHMGAVIEECSIPSLKYAVSTYYIISSAEASSNLSRYDSVRFGMRADDCESMDELYLNSRNEYFGKEVKKRIILGTFALSRDYYDLYYQKAKKARGLITWEFNAVLGKYKLLLAPVCPEGVWKREAKRKKREECALDICTVGVGLAGLPGISIPAGFDKNNMPIGIQLIGRAFDEKTILNAAYAFQKNGGANNV